MILGLVLVMLARASAAHVAMTLAPSTRGNLTLVPPSAGYVRLGPLEPDTHYRLWLSHSASSPAEFNVVLYDESHALRPDTIVLRRRLLDTVSTPFRTVASAPSGAFVYANISCVRGVASVSLKAALRPVTAYLYLYEVHPYYAWLPPAAFWKLVVVVVVTVFAVTQLGPVLRAGVHFIRRLPERVD